MIDWHARSVTSSLNHQRMQPAQCPLIFVLLTGSYPSLILSCSQLNLACAAAVPAPFSAQTQTHVLELTSLACHHAQACHDLVPPDALQPVLRQVVDGFVHDRARPEVMTLGLRSVRGMCARTPLVMNPDLLQVGGPMLTTCITLYFGPQGRKPACARGRAAVHQGSACETLEGSQAGCTPLSRAWPGVPCSVPIQWGCFLRAPLSSASCPLSTCADAAILGRLQDLAQYRTFREKEVTSAARSLISLFRELAPGMLEKRDRGRGADMTLQPLAYGSHKAIERIPGAELLEAELAHGGQADRDETAGGDEPSDDDASADGEESALDEDESADEAGEEGDSGEEGVSDDEPEHSLGEVEEDDLDDDVSEAEASELKSEHEDDALEADQAAGSSQPASGLDTGTDEQASPSSSPEAPTPKPARQQPQPESLAALRQQLSAASNSRKRARLDPSSTQPQPLVDQPSDGPPAAQPDEGAAPDVPLEYGRFLTAEDFDRIRELRQQKMVDAAMAKHGLKSSAKRAKLLAAAQDDAEEALEALVSPHPACQQTLDEQQLRWCSTAPSGL